MQTKIDVRKISLIGFGIALNVVGAFIAFSLRLPIYMDSIGTIFIACLLGPKYAILTGVGGSLISGFTFDVYSFYFAPVQISTGFIAGHMYRRQFLKGWKTPLGVLAFALPTSIISACITSAVFGGITSSGSSYIVQILSTVGVPEVVSVFMTQVVTDYTDKYIAVLFVMAVCRVLPQQFKYYRDEHIQKG